jgi:sec-independent protein translocase protein TatA
METLAFLNLGFPEMILIGVVGLLVFGNRLPQVGRSLGKGIVEFKKGLRGIKEEFDSAVNDHGQEEKPRRALSETKSEAKNVETPAGADGKELPADAGTKPTPAAETLGQGEAKVEAKTDAATTQSPLSP